MADDKLYIIDPLTTICKIALLHFMPEGTRLTISNHVMGIQQYTYSQWFERMKNGDTRRDIANLNTPFIKAMKWYVLEGPEMAIMDEETINNIRTICEFTIKGLQKMQNTTYVNRKGTKIILQYYINMIRDALSGNWKDENIIKFDTDNILLSDKIKNNFESNIINSISKMLIDASKIEKSIEDVNALIECSHKLLLNRDVIFSKIMRGINTTL